MDQVEQPTTPGILKPVGHTLIAFDTEGELQSATAALRALNFADASLVRYSAADMATRVDAELLAAGPLANFGYELDLLRAHGALAKKGCVFLVVHAPTETLSAHVAELVKSIKPASAQHYGRLLVEDLTEKPPGRMGDEETPG
jgi:hypothetical protein